MGLYTILFIKKLLPGDSYVAPFWVSKKRDMIGIVYYTVHKETIAWRLLCRSFLVIQKGDMIVYYTIAWRLTCSSFWVMTCFLKGGLEYTTQKGAPEESLGYSGLSLRGLLEIARQPHKKHG